MAATSKVFTSPSGKYTLNIDIETRPVQITIQPGNHDVTATGLNRGLNFFQRDGVEWVHFSTTSYSQQFINLETGESYNNEGPAMSHNFCWAEAKISPDGTTAAVVGCYWASTYEMKFFDISHPESGIVEISIKDEDIDFYMAAGYAAEEFSWLNDTDLEFVMQDIWCPKFGKFLDDLLDEDLTAELDESDETALIFRLQLRRESDYMIYILKESTPYYDEKIAATKIHREKSETFNKNFPSNTRYQQLKQAYPNAQIFFFHHNGAHEDLNSDIQDVHFGGWINTPFTKGDEISSGGITFGDLTKDNTVVPGGWSEAPLTKLEIKSFKDKTLIGEKEFMTMEEALASLSL